MDHLGKLSDMEERCGLVFMAHTVRLPTFEAKGMPSKRECKNGKIPVGRCDLPVPIPQPTYALFAFGPVGCDTALPLNVVRA